MTTPRLERHHGRRRRRQLRRRPGHAAPADGGLPAQGQARRLLRAAALHRNVFDDVPCSNIFAPWIEELARRGITGGCGGGNYCPTNPVPPRTRWRSSCSRRRMARATCLPPATGDLRRRPLLVAFAAWIEDLVGRGSPAAAAPPQLYCPTTDHPRADGDVRREDFRSSSLARRFTRRTSFAKRIGSTHRSDASRRPPLSPCLAAVPFRRDFHRHEHQRLGRRLAAPGDPGRQRRRRRRHRRLQHRRLGRAHDRARHLPARDQSAAHDRRLHAVGLLPEHARHDAGSRHGPPDRDRRRRIRRQLDLPRCRGGGRHDPRPRDPQLRLRRHPAPELRHEHRDRGQLPRKRPDGNRRAVRVEASGPHRRRRARESPDRRDDAGGAQPHRGRPDKICVRSGRRRLAGP